MKRLALVFGLSWALASPLASAAVAADIEKAVFALTNEQRAKHGVPALEFDADLTATARGHSQDMLNRRFFSHENPDGEGSDDRIARHCRRLIGETGENVWMSSGRIPQLATEIVETWMERPGHRRNILAIEFTHLGVGVVVEGRDGWA